MKFNKIKNMIITIFVTILIILSLGQTVSYAAEGNLTAALDKYRYLPTYNESTKQFTYNSTGWGFKIGVSGHTIYQINELDSSSNITGGNSRLYCLNARVGDVWNNNQVGLGVEYKNYFDWRNEKESILANDTEGILTSEYYSAVIWLLDNFYIPNVTDKESFFKNVGFVKDESLLHSGEKFYTYFYTGTEKYIEHGDTLGYCYQDNEGKVHDISLTDDMIETVQQAAIWYFTNYKDGNKENIFNNYQDKEATMLTSWLYYTKDGNTYASLKEVNEEGFDGDTDGIVNVGEMYHEQASILYNYFIDKALEANEAGYTGKQTVEASLSINSSSATIEKQANGTSKIGPLTIETTGMVSGLTLTVKDDSGADITCTKPSTVKAGTEFYIENIPSEFEGNVNIYVTANGNTTTQNLWKESGLTHQPIVEINREEIQLDDDVIFTIVKEKNFDLALRKTITGVKNASGAVVSIINENGLDATRTIKVNVATIPDTATYKHRKDPVVVGKDYIVTYKLSIYNEGDVDGYASIVVDQLPTGLISTLTVGDTVTSSKGNTYQVKSYENNKLILEIVSATPKMIGAYKNNALDYDVIELQCKVTQKEDSSKHYLTNIAYINEAKDAEGNIQVQDRYNETEKTGESKPELFPEYSADDLNKTEPAYQGKDNQSIYNDTNNEYYYKGQEDDDDFETIVILGKEFDLKLVKYISKINNKPSNREISVDSSKLNKIISGVKITTADYDVSKLPITVKTGDFVTYTFRIYNEADLDGYASEITEDIPEGLEYVYSTLTTDAEIDADTKLSEKEKVAIKFNRNYGWTFTDSELNTISTNYLSNISTDNLIKAFDESKDNGNGEGLSYKEVSVMFKVISTDVTNIIRNEAAITDDTDVNGDPISDRDSDTEQWKKEDSEDFYDNEDYPKYKEDDEDYDNIKLVRFDLALRKFIVAVSQDTVISSEEYVSSRAPQVDTSKLKTGENQTAIYNHPKNSIAVNAGDYVLYTIRVYNEGDIDGYASKITDYLPEYLNYIDGEFNKGYGWEYNSEDRSITTNYLSSENGVSNKLEAFDRVKDNGKGSGLDYKDIQVLCRVSTEAVAEQNITNIAEIREYQDEEGTIMDIDPDSDPSNLEYPENVPEYEGNRDGQNASDTYYPGQEDDDDFDRVIILRGMYDVILIKQDETGEQLNSEATFEVNGVTKKVVGKLTIADDVEINVNNLKQKDTYTIKETVAPDEYCEFDGIINIDVNKKQSSNKLEVDNVVYTVTDSNGNQINTQDAKVYLKDGNIYVEVINYELKFDLALRKFITKINEENVTTRIPEVSVEDGKITYTHPKDVVKVAVGDIVTYTIRVYNEGKTAGYAQTITDDIPEYLEYLPGNATNTAYRWKMYDKDGKETDNVSKADKIVTDYTSKEYGEESMQEGENITENPNLLNAFNPLVGISNTNPEYVDVKVAFKVKDPKSSKYIIKNKAQISEDADEKGNPVEDIDSVPNKWNEGEDDQDYENVSVEYFDLSLLKYVSEVHVTEKGKTTKTKTGNKGDKNDIIPKVEIHRKNVKSTKVKFIYTIKITNEGDVAGYAKEITDYIPKGLKFHKEDNKGWKEIGNNKIATEMLSDKLLQPGESATVKVTLRWINDENNMGPKVNIAEISKDENEGNVLDRDSIPGNEKDKEDDIDDAEVLISIKTGVTENIIAYITGAAIVLLVIAGGVILIKKYVL